MESDSQISHDSFPYNDIVKRCPLLYKRGMCFECGPGWKKIIADLSDALEKEISKMKEEGTSEQWLPYAIQVKEKYGTLRFYMFTETDEIIDLIEKAQDLSQDTCEMCGEKGTLQNRHWIEVLCDKCKS